MNKSYLLSILDLYLLKEENNNLIVEVVNLNDQVKIYFSYTNSPLNKTFVKVNKDVFLSSLNEFVPKIQGNLENVSELKSDLKYIYTFAESRRLSFQNFLESDIKLIKEQIKNLEEKKEEELVIDPVIEIPEEEINYDTKLVVNKKFKLDFSMGFANYITLFTTSILFLDILLIALWLFKAFIK